MVGYELEAQKLVSDLLLQSRATDDSEGSMKLGF